MQYSDIFQYFVDGVAAGMVVYFIFSLLGMSIGKAFGLMKGGK